MNQKRMKEIVHAFTMGLKAYHLDDDSIFKTKDRVLEEAFDHGFTVGAIEEDFGDLEEEKLEED